MKKAIVVVLFLALGLSLYACSGTSEVDASRIAELEAQVASLQAANTANASTAVDDWSQYTATADEWASLAYDVKAHYVEYKTTADACIPTGDTYTWNGFIADWNRKTDDLLADIEGLLSTSTFADGAPLAGFRGVNISLTGALGQMQTGWLFATDLIEGKESDPEEYEYYCKQAELYLDDVSAILTRNGFAENVNESAPSSVVVDIAEGLPGHMPEMVLYEGTGVTIVALEQELFTVERSQIRTMGMIEGPGMIVEISNNSTEDRGITVDSCTVNGYMVDPIFLEELMPGAKVRAQLMFPYDDIDQNGIEEIEYVELRMVAIEGGLFGNHVVGDVVRINLTTPLPVPQ